MAKHKWGKINHGQTYGLIADDVARRLATVKLGDYERLLLEVIREHSWAHSTRRKSRDGKWPDALPFSLSMDAVAREIASGQMDETQVRSLRKRLYEAVKSLKDARILVESEGEVGGLLINTDCDEWHTYGREMFPHYVCVSYAIKAQSSNESTPTETPKGGAKDPVSPADATDDRIRQNGYAYPPERACVSARTDTCIRQNGHEEGFSHYIEPARNLDLIQTNLESEFADARAPEIPSTHNAPSATPPLAIHYPPDVDPQAPNLLTPEDRAELDRLAALCDVWFPMLEQIKSVVERREGNFPVWAYGPALSDLRKKPPHLHRRNFFLGCVATIAAAGPEAAAAMKVETAARPQGKAKDQPVYTVASAEVREIFGVHHLAVGY